MQFKNKNLTQKIFLIFLYGFSVIGIIFSAVFVAMRLHLTDVAGSIDSRNAYFNQVKKEATKVSSLSKTNYLNKERLDPVTSCQIMTINSVLPSNGQVILDTYVSTRSTIIAQKMIKAVMLVTTNNSFLQDKIARCDAFADNLSSESSTPSNQNIFDWVSSEEWQAIRDALIKDKDVIAQASNDSGVPARYIVSAVISEQFRFFTANRESFKRYFEPLKILGNGTKFSYGVAGVKIETAAQIESYLKDSNSKFYLGQDYEHIFDRGPNDSDTDMDSLRLARLTDNKNHYYSYLYTGIFLKQIMHQWDQAGYPVNDRPEVLATLFNLGFVKSSPKEDPEVGGSTITVNDRDYTFGGLSYEFYYSGELSDIFPIGVQ
jgi:hypothetical protein